MLSCGDIIAATLALVCVGTLFINPFARSLNTFFVVSNYGSGAAFFVTHFVLKASFLYSSSIYKTVAKFGFQWFSILMVYW